VLPELELGVDQRGLAEAMGTDPAHISLIVDRLHSRGLIERRINDADRRARKLYLTPKGRACGGDCGQNFETVRGALARADVRSGSF